MTDFNNNSDIIDSRDVIERIEELEGERDAFIEEWLEDSESEATDDMPWIEMYSEDAAELSALQDLAKEASGYAADWLHGETLVRDTYFTEYAQQLAEGLGVIDSNASWPLTHIDWDAAADALKIDYTEVDFDGVGYYIR